MKSILLELFQGEIAPIERYTVILKEYREQWKRQMFSQKDSVSEYA